MPDWSRRALLSSVGATVVAGVAGCLDRTASARGATDVTLHNEHDERRSVEVTVSPTDAEGTVVDRSIELAPHESLNINNEVIMGSTYEVSVRMVDEGYDETYTWEDAGDPMHVLLTGQVVFAIQVG